MYRWALFLVLVSCVGAVPPDDPFWDDAEDDDLGDGNASLAADKGVAIGVGAIDKAELVEHLPVARTEQGAKHRTVLRLDRADLPRLAKGDRLITPAEVQVTTRCDVLDTAPGCNYAPHVKAQLVLGDQVIATQSATCTSNAHHCMFVFTPGEASITVHDQPCVRNDDCTVELAMWAWHPSARANDQDEVLVGGNDGVYLDNHRVEPDLARLMAVRERGIVAADRKRDEAPAGGGNTGIPTTANPVTIYSLELKNGQDLVPGEQYLVEARLPVVSSARARVSSQLVLSKNNGISPGAISEHNGYNCTGSTGCAQRKVAVFRVTNRVAGPVRVKLEVRSSVPGPGSANVTAKPGDGYLRVVRYPAALDR
jgi:hypothetical protein